MICNCCGNGWSGFAPDGDGWKTCRFCGVFINANPPDDSKYAGTINTDMYLTVRDVEKFVPLLDEIGSYVSLSSIYSVCTGFGYFEWLCRLRGVYARGNDINPVSVRTAKELFRVELDQMHFENILYPDKSFDAVIFHHGIEHVRRPYEALQKAAKILRRGGIIYLAHPAMKDREWFMKYGDAGHYHEWTVDSFSHLVSRIDIDCRVVRETHGEFNGGEASQYWILERR